MCPFLLMGVTLCKSILGRHIILQHNFDKIDGTSVLNRSGLTSIETQKCSFEIWIPIKITF